MNNVTRFNKLFNIHHRKPQCLTEGEVRGDLELYEETNHSNFCPLRFAPTTPSTNPSTTYPPTHHEDLADANTFWATYHYPPLSSPDHPWENKQSHQHVANHSSFHPHFPTTEKASLTATITTKATNQDVVVSSNKSLLPHQTTASDPHYHYGPDLVMNQNYHLLVVQDQPHQLQKPPPQPHQFQKLPQTHQPQTLQQPQKSQQFQLKQQPQNCKVERFYDKFHTCIHSINNNTNNQNDSINNNTNTCTNNKPILSSIHWQYNNKNNNIKLVISSKFIVKKWFFFMYSWHFKRNISYCILLGNYFP